MKSTLFAFQRLLNLTSFDEAIREEQIENMQLYIKYDAAIVDKQVYEMVPLYYALTYNKLNSFVVLLENNANIEQRNQNDGQTPIFLAISAKSDSAIELLLFRHANYQQVTNNKGQTPLDLATSGQVELIKETAEKVKQIEISEKAGKAAFLQGDKESAMSHYSVAATIYYEQAVKVSTRDNSQIFHQYYVGKALADFLEAEKCFENLSGHTSERRQVLASIRQCYQHQGNNKAVEEYNEKLAQIQQPAVSNMETGSGLRRRHPATYQTNSSADEKMNVEHSDAAKPKTH